jgi:imidazole glycerol-phosphate synthase subunit HisF
MPAFRIIPIILYNGEQAVKTVNFKNPRNVGSVLNLARLYEARGVDELIFLDIFASRENRDPNFKLVRSIAKSLSIPFAVGGGIRNIMQTEELLSLGADRVVIGSGSGRQVEVCEEISSAFGAQAVIAAIDYHDGEDLFCRTFDLHYFCGEFILTSIDREGTMQGPDRKVAERICGAEKRSMIVHGGVSAPLDVLTIALSCRADAIGIGSMFHFTQFTPNDVKQVLKNHSVEVRT